MGSLSGVIEKTYSYIPEAMLKTAIENHVKWIDAGGENGKRLDFEGADLSARSLRGVNLSGARIRKCSLKGADLTDAVCDMVDMTYCDLSHANLSRASLRGTTMRGVNLSHANMLGARVSIMPFKGTRSWPANLDRAILHNTDLTQAIFEHAIMSYADMTGSILTGTTFIEVDLTKVKRSTVDKGLPHMDCKRASQRYTEPKLFVKMQHGVFTTANWSMSGITLTYDGGKVFAEDDEIVAKIVAGGQPPPQDARFTVVKFDESRGIVLMKFVNMSEGLSGYLRSLVE